MKFCRPLHCVSYNPLPRIAWHLLGCCLVLSAHGAAVARLQADEAQALEHAAIEGAEVVRSGDQLLVTPLSSQASGQVAVPRLAASLRSLSWLEPAATDGLSLKPEPEQWLISWSERPSGAKTIVLAFDGPPKLLSELAPQQAAGDGSVYLPACMATTQGEKVRYEPQTYKNTVGYWTGKQDSVSWEFEITQAGEFNVGLLQGCGKGQGGSRARLRVELLSATQAAGTQVAELEFDVLETGHFQNFQWRHVGVLSLTQPGIYRLALEPQSIHKAALMDVRAVHLVRLP